MNTSDYTYTLPEERIAQHPPAHRGGSRLLVVEKDTGSLHDRTYPDIVSYVRAGDVVVLNDTKVIPARLQTKKQSTQVGRELILTEQHGAVDDWYRHTVLYRRSLKPGDTLIATDGSELFVEALLGEGIALIRSHIDLLELAEKVGEVPLPPYMKRKATPDDVTRYQTVWARQAGSVAAPTASLNMTTDTLNTLRDKGAVVVYVTLHVGMGTFLPIRTDDIAHHVMHKEYYEIPAATVTAIQAAKAAHKRVVAVGTTVTRTLEYAAPQILHEPPKDLHGEADIFIYPGYHFKLIDMLLTNFHAPRSTVLMLTAAFAGWENLRRAYEHALANNYQFLSYGDSMLITDHAETA